MFAPGGSDAGSETAAELVEAARQVAADVLAPAAAAVDQGESIPPGHLRALGRAGLFGLFGPDPVPAPDVRSIFEILAGACGVTFFVWVQHHAPVRLLRASPNARLRDRLLPALTSGELLGGVAFAHLRRPGPPAVVARPIDGGYALDGEAPWVTSWGLAGVFAVAGLTVHGDGGGNVVFCAIRPDTAGLRASPPLRLAAMNASSTVRLAFDGVRVDAADVIVEQPLAEWRRNDRRATAQPNPAAFGVAATCTRLLADLDPEVAAALEAERQDCRAQSYGLADSDAPDLERLMGLRAWSLELSLRAAYALVTATGGRSMELSHPAQRLLREASFYAIQAQTQALRSATLARLVH